VIQRYAAPLVASWVSEEGRMDGSQPLTIRDLIPVVGGCLLFHPSTEKRR